jgi:light-regulated signal transduction histidine kinase (bacteriophytochrome)
VELQAKSAELERFFYTVLHDLKSSLVTIQSFVGLLARDARECNEARMEQDIHYISDAALGMGHRLTELLELSRIGRLDNRH